MATDMCTRRLRKELKALQKDPMKSPKITVMPREENILEMHYVIEGSEDSPYAGGIYHGKLVFPATYPLKPPSVIMLTPSGRFQPNRRLCLSMSDFHPETWNPVWSVETILAGLYSFMVETAPTLGSVETSTRQKRQYAQQSLAYNVRDPMFQQLFPEYVEQYQKIMDERGEEVNTLATSESAERRNNEGIEIQGIFATAAGLVALLSIFFAMRFL
ncbi:Probable ubiquitin-conjugating enzyme E2 33 [Seminavis robusta]|uniref:E2 ubiquitin-conjugating enzyme n=1 Tax=Seminavis robusta TaxID=568900 RepID=A0A9N8ED20_9STRA|nr:Probable ubiquitin-conjugating enzyme E2 33 [Seminavis robusta]|eukprot:Sro767_g199460.1 Probable ubiquitin-conjugating enzyme E2 33 (216) ;mRNA; f:19805-20670